MLPAGRLSFELQKLMQQVSQQQHRKDDKGQQQVEAVIWGHGEK